MNAVTYRENVKPDTVKTVSALVQHISFQAEGRDKAMDLKSQDTVERVIDKLETLSSLFEFYWYARNKTGFNENSINGLCLIIADCITELKEAVK